MRRFLKMTKSKNFLVLSILLIGLFLRIYKARSLFVYSHDQDLSSWIVKDIVLNGHLRLGGQQTSILGVFIGPLFYYLLVPFYLLFRMDPVAGVALVTTFGIFSVGSSYFVFSKLFGKIAGLVGGLFWATSYFFIFNDREVVPTMPVVLWTLWFFYALNLLLKGNRLSYPLLGFLVGLIWNLNLALFLLVPLALLASTVARRKISFKGLLIGIVVALIVSLPLIFFEARHNFLQTRALLGSSGSFNIDRPSFPKSLDRTLYIVSRNTQRILLGSEVRVHDSFSLTLLLVSLGLLIYKKKISKDLAILLVTWVSVYIVFFTLYPIVLSEYYLNGLAIVWFATIVLTISSLLSPEGRSRRWGMVLLVFLLTLNFYRFIKHPINRIGYLEKKALVSFIDEDSKKRGYPCVSVSYIVEPGYDLGYRYLFFLGGMHVNRPLSGSPVYTIVFPHSKVGRIDKSFGALGLVLPDYERYEREQVLQSCSGENSNLTDPMFGFTQ